MPYNLLKASFKAAQADAEYKMRVCEFVYVVMVVQ